MQFAGGQRWKRPAIALSALGKDEAQTKAIKAGFQEYLGKPVRLFTLIGTIAGARQDVNIRITNSKELGYASPLITVSHPIHLESVGSSSARKDCHSTYAIADALLEARSNHGKST